jgi:crossover junction endodeoxyribonuclease RuvC
MRVLGIDPSLTATGVALPDGTVATVAVKLSKGGRLKHVRESDRLIAIRDRVACLLDDVDLVVVEGYSYGSGFQAHQLGELGGVLRVLLTEAGVAWVEVAPTRVKRYATGKGNAGKADMLLAAQCAGVATTDHNAADAWWLRAVGVHALTGDPVDGGDRRPWRDAMADEVRVMLPATCLRA